MATAGLRRFFAGVALAGLLPLTTASVPFAAFVTTVGHEGNVTIAVNAPDDAPDDLYFHYSSPSDGKWTAFGFGEQMAGSLIFVMYPSADQKNITVSPRLGTGEVMPKRTTAVNATVLAGSGFDEGLTVANVHCTGCRKWNGGSLDVKNTRTPLIWAIGPSAVTPSDDRDMIISQHQGHETGWSLDMTTATGAAGVPDLLASSTNPDGNSTGSPNGSITTGSGASITGPSRGPIVIHALLMLAAFVIIFPGGYLFLRVFEKVWIHMGLQSLGLLFVLGGMISGIAISVNRKISPSLNTPHQAIGLVASILVFTAWGLGFVGHQMFKRNGTAGIPTMIHRAVGPSAIILGLANGASGFHFASRNVLIVPYIIIVLFVAIVVMSALFFVRKRKMRQAAMTTPAAQNFQHAYFGGNGGFPPPQQHGVPMQTFGPGEVAGLPKQPAVSVQPAGRFS